MQNFFYSFEFNDIQKLLFTPRWTETDERKKQKFLKDNTDLSELSDEELRSAFASFTSKSDWEKFFSAKMVNLNVEQVLEEIRKHRNAIAHCKFFRREEFETCSKAIQTMNLSVITAIKITEEKDFPDKNSEALRGALSELFVGLKSFAEGVTKSMFSIAQNVLVPAFKEWQRMVKELQQPFLPSANEKKSTPIDDTESPDGETGNNE